MRHTRDRERGIALPAAVLALVVVGALIAGVFFLARVEQLSAINTVGAAQAAQTADAGLASVVGGPANPYRSLAVGATSAPVVSVLAGNPLDRYTVRVTKLNDDNRYVVESLGERLDPGGAVVASRRVLQFVRIVGGSISVGPAAFVGLGSVLQSSGNSSGVDAAPPGLGCPAPGPNGVSFRLNPGPLNQIWPGGDSPGRAIPDGSLTASDFESFGQATFDELAASADVRILTPATFDFTNIRPQVLSGNCVTTNPANWGEPDPTSFPSTTACRDYVPIIYIQGDATITGLRGQGFLLVDGNVTFGGQMQFYGLVVARGTVNTTTPAPAPALPGLVTGMAMGKNQAGTSHQLVEDIDFQYSSCTVNRALASVGRFAPFNERSWLQLYQ